jgi:hypothetical protein
VRRSGSTSEFWLIDAGTIAAYLILAIAWGSASKGKLNLRSKVLVALACSTTVLIGLVQSFVATANASDSPFLLPNRRLEVLFVAGFVGAMAFIVWIATRTRTGTPRLASCVAIVGCLLVLSSLVLPITLQSDSSQRAAGWRILDRQEHWITSYASVGQSAAFGDRIPWLQPVFQVAGFSFYAVAVLATIAMFITLIALRLSPARLAPTSVFRRLTAVLSLASVWVLEDIHWGWHFDFSGFVYAALAATGFWLTMIVISAVVAWRIAVSDPSPALISWLRLIQIPMIAFNLSSCARTSSTIPTLRSRVWLRCFSGFQF